MKTISTFLVVFCLSLLTIAQDLKTNNAAEQMVLEVSKKELVSFLDGIPKGFEKQHGFQSREEFKLAQPGKIYHIMGMDQEGKLFETNLYQVAVVVNGQYRSMLTVANTNGVYSVESVGASLLAKELGVFENHSTTKDGSERVILNFYDKKCGFVAYKSDSEDLEGLTYKPLESATEALVAERKALKQGYLLSELRKELR